jgi:DNA-binding transcriptional LysR family regulator
LPLRWITGKDFIDRPEEPLSLVLFEAPCFFRSRALDALETIDRPWRNAMISPSLTGLWAAVGAGLGLTVRVEHGIPQTLRVGEIDLPPLGKLGITFHRRKG